MRSPVPALRRAPRPRTISALPLLAFAVGWVVACAETSEGRHLWFDEAPGTAAAMKSAALEQATSGKLLEVAPPPFSEGIFPCMDCHAELEPDPTPRKLEEHQGIALEHGDRPGWCFDCHDPADRNSLRLASGAKVPFTESYRLCGQCHGDKYRDWRAGVHGKRTGQWSGEKQYLLCASCHNPHSPSFKPIAPRPRPLRPDETLRDAP